MISVISVFSVFSYFAYEFLLNVVCICKTLPLVFT